MASDSNTTRLTRREIEEMIARGEDRTDWTKVDSISDAELDEIVRNDPDDVYLTEAELADAVPIYPVDLKKLCSRLGLTQESFAARLGFSLGTLRNWERGRHVHQPRPARPPAGFGQHLGDAAHPAEGSLGRRAALAAGVGLTDNIPEVNSMVSPNFATSLAPAAL